MLKIFYVIDSFAIGGAETQLLELLRRLDRANYETAVCPVWTLGAMEEEYRHTRTQIVKVHKKSHLDLTFAWRLARRMREFRPHIVHAWLYTGNLWGHMAAALARVPVVILSHRTAQRNGLLPGYVSWGHALAHILAGRVDVFIANSQAGLMVHGVPGRKFAKRVQVIYNGIDLLRFHPDGRLACRWENHQALGLSPETLVIGTIGRLAPEKRFDLLFRALSFLFKTGYNFATVLVGDGPMKAELKSLAGELNLQDRVIFLGQRRDIPQLLSLVDIFVLPSDCEGFPNVLLEAMAMAKPVVATRVGGTSELVEEGITGLLVEAGNPRLLADAIARLIDNPQMATAMGLRGRQQVEQAFNLDHMVAQTTSLYRDLLREKGILA